VSLPLLSPVLSLLDDLLHQALSFVLTISIVFALLHRAGILQRALHRLAERELSKITNGARITVFKIEWDFIAGKVKGTDLVIHSPQRDEWKWDSPLIARLGHVDVHVSLFSLIDPLAYYLGYRWRDIHSVVVQDVQVFVEKRRNVFNFHLLDESLDIPDPAEIIASPNLNDESEERKLSPELKQSSLGPLEMIPSGDAFSFSSNSSEGSLSDKGDGESTISKESTSSGDGAEKKANEIVSSMLKSVSTLGKAANEGGKDGFERAFHYQKMGIVDKLKQFQENVGKRNENESSPNNSNRLLNRSSTGLPSPRTNVTNPRSLDKTKSSMELMAIEGMKVMKQMGKAVQQNVKEIEQSIKPPGKKKDYVNPVDDLFRIGHIVVKDVHIFTKDVLLSGSPVTDKNRKRSQSDSAIRWSKPMLLKEVILGGTELCSPTSVRDEFGMPVIGLRIEKILDIIVKKTFGEMAKTNTARVMQNAFGEVFAWMDFKGSSAKNSGGSSSKKLGEASSGNSMKNSIRENGKTSSTRKLATRSSIHLAVATKP